MKNKEAIEFLEELRNSLCNPEEFIKIRRESWNKNINGLNRVIWLLKVKEAKSDG